MANAPRHLFWLTPHSLLRLTSPPFSTLHSAHLTLLPLHLRKIKHLTHTPLQLPPRRNIPPHIPRQRPHPRLHIPPQLERRIPPLRNQTRVIRDYVLGLLIAQLEDAWSS